MDQVRISQEIITR